MVSNAVQAGRPLSLLARTTVVALVANMLAYASEFHLIGQLDREVSMVVAGVALAAILVATGRRWTPALAALVAGGILIGNPFLLHNLSLPATSGFFVAAVVQVVSGVVIVVAGIAATVQNYR